MSTRGRQIGDMLRRAARLQIAETVRKAYNFVGVADIHPLRIFSRGVKRDSVRALQSAGEDLHLLRLAVGSQATKNANASGSAFREEDVAIGSSPQQARTIQARRIVRNLEPCRRDGPHICRSRTYIGTIFRRLRCVRLGKIIHSDLPRLSRFFVSEISEWRLGGWRLEACGGDARGRWMPVGRSLQQFR